MSIAKTLTWQHDVNISLPAVGGAADARALFFAWKEALIGFATNAYTVAGSSDGSTAGMDATDRWVDADDLVMVASSGAHGWIVLENPITGAQMLLSMIVGGTTNAQGVKFAFSPGGLYTGGNASTDPTASDEIVILSGATNNSYGRGNSSSSQSFDLVLQMMHSADGLATVWAICYNSTCTALGYMGEIDQPQGDNLLVCGWLAAAANPAPALTISHAFDQISAAVSVHRFRWAGLPSNTTAACYFVMPAVSVGGSVSTRTPTLETAGSNTASPNQIVDPPAHEHPSVGCYSAISGDRGIHGRLYDVRWAGDDLGSGSAGDTFPGEGQLWAKFGPWVLPWNGTTPVVA